MNRKFILTLNSIIEARDPLLKGHCQRVAQYSAMIADEIKLPPDVMKAINYAAQIHDIGKIGISDMVLLKSDKLTDEDYKLIKTHPIIGHKIIEHLKFFRADEHFILHHHERYDGTGYPMGLKKEAIPLGARIIAIADAFDAMNFSRPYRPAIELWRIKEIIKENLGSQFDPYLAKIFLNIIGKVRDVTLARSKEWELSKMSPEFLS